MTKPEDMSTWTAGVKVKKLRERAKNLPDKDVASVIDKAVTHLSSLVDLRNRLAHSIPRIAYTLYRVEPYEKDGELVDEEIDVYLTYQPNAGGEVRVDELDVKIKEMRDLARTLSRLCSRQFKPSPIPSPPQP
jgi:hypothetical protein